MALSQQAPFDAVFATIGRISTTVVGVFLGRAAATLPRFWPIPRSSPIPATASAPSGREDSALAAHSTHIPSASDAQSPPRSPAGPTCMAGQVSSLWTRRVVTVATLPQPEYRAMSFLSLPASLANLRARTAVLVCKPSSVDSGDVAPRLAGVGASLTNPAPPPRCVQPSAPAARTHAEFLHSSVGTQPPLRFEAAQAARPCQIHGPLLWRHGRPTLRSYHAQKGLSPHRQRHMAIPADPRPYFIVVQTHLAIGIGGATDFG